MTREEAIETLVKLQYIIDGEDSHWNIPMHVVFDAILTVVEELRKDNIIIKNSYEQGLKDAWECAKKISATEDSNYKVFAEIFNKENENECISTLDVIEKCSITDVMQKIKDYEEKIKVGDEVQDIHFGEKMIVIETYSDGGLDGFNFHRGLLSNRDATNWKKTGKFYPEAEAIARILHQARRERNND